jgi:hypothetical protein
VQAWEGSQRMQASTKIQDIQLPVDRRLQGTSAWLRATAERAANA